MRPALGALLFDVDGTLADTERLGHLPAYNQAFSDLGLPWRWDEELYRDDLLLQPGGRERIRHFVVQYKPDLAEHQSIADENLAAWVNHVHAEKSRCFQARVEAGRVPLRPGVARLIREAVAARVRIALVTNASTRSLQPLLEHTLGPDLRSHIEFIMAGEEVRRKKPAPDLYLRALERLGLAAEAVVAVEDSAMGLAAARAAGIATLVTTNSDTQAQNFEAAAAVCAGLGEPEAHWQVQGCGMEQHPYATPQALNALLQCFHQAHRT